ncbi:sortase-dependent protein, partial [Streptomyces prasinus]
MRRTVLSAAALACTAVLVSAVPAFAADPTPVAEATVAPGDSSEPNPCPTQGGDRPARRPGR